FHHLRGLRRGGLFGFAVFHEFESLHEAPAAHVANERVFLLELFELGAEVGAHGVGVFAEVVFFDEFDGGAGSGASYGIAPERSDVQSLESGGNFWSCDREADWNAVGHTFGAGENVRRHFPLLDAEPFFSGAAPAGLHFIGDEEAAVFLYDVENDLEIFLGRSDEPADALDGFGDERGDAAAGAGLDEVFDVTGARYFAFGVFQMEGATVAIRIDGVRDSHADDGGFAIRSVRGHGFHERRAARIGMAESDDVVAAGGHAGDQDGSFVGLAAGASEEARRQITGSNL